MPPQHGVLTDIFSTASPPVFELLSTHHDRGAFDCGQQSLNDFLQRQARQNATRNLGATHVAVSAPGDAHILGYYSLAVRTLERDTLPNPRKFPPDGIGVALLGRLAVDVRAQGAGLGTVMLLRAIKQTEIAARDLGIYALVVDALDESARQWYLRWKFEPLSDNPRHLYLSIATIRELGLAT